MLHSRFRILTYLVYLTYKKSEFKKDISSFWKTATILFIIANIIAGIVGVFKTYIWSRYNPSRFNPENWLLVVIARFIITMMKHWSEAMFFYLFVMSGYWFVFYKMQNTAHFLVPDPTTASNEYRPFYVVFIITIIFQFLTTLNMIREQVNMDFFFIDWVTLFCNLILILYRKSQDLHTREKLTEKSISNLLGE